MSSRKNAVVYEDEESFVKIIEEKITDFHSKADVLNNKHETIKSLEDNFRELTASYSTILRIREDDQGLFALDFLEAILKNYFLTFLFLFDSTLNNRNGRIFSKNVMRRCQKYILTDKFNDFVISDYNSPKKTDLSYMCIEGIEYFLNLLASDFKAGVKQFAINLDNISKRKKRNENCSPFEQKYLKFHEDIICYRGVLYDMGKESGEMERAIKSIMYTFCEENRCHKDGGGRPEHLFEELKSVFKTKDLKGVIHFTRASVAKELDHRVGEIGTALIENKVLEIADHGTRLNDLLLKQQEIARVIEEQATAARMEINAIYDQNRARDIAKGKEKLQQRAANKGANLKRNVNIAIAQQNTNIATPLNKKPRRGKLVVTDDTPPQAAARCSGQEGDETATDQADKSADEVLAQDLSHDNKHTTEELTKHTSALEDGTEPAMLSFLKKTDSSSKKTDSGESQSDDDGEDSMNADGKNDTNADGDDRMDMNSDDGDVHGRDSDMHADNDLRDSHANEEVSSRSGMKNADEDDERESDNDDDDDTDVKVHKEEDPKFYVPFNDSFFEYRKQLDALGEKVGIEKVYQSLDFDKLLSNSNGKTAEENFLDVQKVFGDIVICDVVNLVKASYGRDANVCALWNFTRQIFDCKSNEIVELRFKDLFYYIKTLALKQFVITRVPKAVELFGKVTLVPSNVPLTKKENRFNSDMSRRVNVYSSSVMKRVMQTYEWLNENLASLPLDAMKGCGFQLPPANDGDFVPLNNDSVIIKFLRKQKFNTEGYEEFKECLFQKKGRDDPDTWIAKKRREKVARVAAKIVEKPLKKKPVVSSEESLSTVERDLLNSSIDTTDNEDDNESEAKKTDMKKTDTDKTVVKKTVDLHGRTSALLTLDNDDNESVFSNTKSNTSQASVSKTAKGNNAVVNEEIYKKGKLAMRDIPKIYGEHGNIRLKCDTAKNKEIQSMFQYHCILSELICSALQYLEDGEVAAEDIGTLLSTHYALQEVRFATWRAMAIEDLESAAGNTMGDGFCMIHATLQNSMRSKNRGISMESLREYDQNLPRKDLAQHIQTYLDSMTCREDKDDLVLKARLKNMMYNAIHFPDSPNPMNAWGNSQMCRFLDGEIMIYTYDQVANFKTEVTMGDRRPGLWGMLSVLNYGVLKRLFPHSVPPTLTLAELVTVFEKSNNIGFKSGHFFVLENHEKSDACSAEAAVHDWVDNLVVAVMDLDEDERAAIRAFHKEVHLQQQTCSQQQECDDGILSISVRITQDDEDDFVPAKTTIKPNGKPICADVSFNDEVLIATIKDLSTRLEMMEIREKELLQHTQDGGKEGLSPYSRNNRLTTDVVVDEHKSEDEMDDAGDD